MSTPERTPEKPRRFKDRTGRWAERIPVLAPHHPMQFVDPRTGRVLTDAEQHALALESALAGSDQPQDRQLLAAIDRWRAGDLT